MINYSFLNIFLFFCKQARNRPDGEWPEGWQKNQNTTKTGVSIFSRETGRKPARPAKPAGTKNTKQMIPES